MTKLSLMVLTSPGTTRTTRRNRFLLGCFAALIVTCPLAARAENGNLVQMTTTTRMRMPGSPMGNMPARTRTDKICMSARKPDPGDLSKNNDCQVTRVTQAGDTMSYHLECTMPGGVREHGDGTLQVRANGDVHGTVHATGSGAMNMTMDMTYNGQRIGSCDYHPPKKRPRSTGAASQ